MIVLELSSRDLGRINSVDLLVSKYYRTSLYNFCSRYGYDKLFLEVIRQVTADYGYEKIGYMEVELPDELDDRYYEVEKKFSYGVDNRGVAERIISLGVNWVVEDVIVHKSSSVFMLTGCDNTRDYLANPITSTPDIRYVGEGESFYVEVCSDFTKFMSRANRYDIRRLKYLKLEDLLLVDRVKTVLLFVDVVNKTFYRIPFKSQPYNQHNKYSKNTVSFEFDDNAQFLSLDILFENCKKRQPNPSLYSNFNIDEEKPKKKVYVDERDEPGYWESLFETAPTFVRTRDYSLDEAGYRSLEEMLEENAEFYSDNGDNNNYSEIEFARQNIDKYSELGFVELPSDTPTPFDKENLLDFGPEPPEPEEPIDTSEHPFVEYNPYDYDPFGDGDGLPF